MMMSRIAAYAVVVAGVALFGVGEVAQAAKVARVSKVAKAAETTHEGKVVSVTERKDGKDGMLVMSDSNDKKEHTHMVLATTKITLNKKSGKLSDLKKGDLVSVTLDGGNKLTAIAATRDAK
jgi:co-chaperonin GroES (HSP10)